MNNDLPPSCSAPEAERWLLSAAINGYPAAIEGMKFYNVNHRALAAQINTLAKRGPVELVSVQNAIHGDVALTNFVTDIFNLASAPTIEVISDCRVEVERAAVTRDFCMTVRDIQNRIAAGNSASVRDEFPAYLTEVAAKMAMASGDGDAQILDARLIDPGNPPTKPVPTYELAGHQICTEGNLTVIASQAKAGKTAAIGGMIASVFSTEFTTDTFRFSSPEDRPGAVIVFDCEQSPYDTYQITKKIMERAGIPDAPERLRVYSLADVPTFKRRELLRLELARASKVNGGIHSVFLDGVADLCIDPNDPAEAFGLVEELHRLAIQFKTVIVVVLHENPGTMNAGKTRGHLGSHLERKAETNLRLVKDDNGITEIFGERCRHCHIPKGKGPRFIYDPATGMHVSCEPAASQKAREDKEAMVELVEEVFENDSVMRNSELTAAIMRVKRVKENAADNWRKKLLKAGLIRRNEMKLYLKAA